MEKHVNDMDKQGADGATPLLAACLQGDVAAAKALLEAGADPAGEGMVLDTTPEVEADRKKWKYFPLGLAAREGHTAIAEMLLACDSVNVNQGTSDTGFTALMMACLVSNSAMIELLLAHDGIEVNKAGTDGGYTPLYAACYSGHVEAIKLLLAHDGIEVNKARTDVGDTPLFTACYHGHVEAIKLLLAHDDIEVNKALTDDGATPLYTACYHDHVDAIKLLLAHDGIEVNKARTDHGDTPLIIACFKGRADAIMLLLAHDGIKVNKATTDNEITPLHAATNDQLLIAQHLVLYGADLSATDCHGRTPTQIAADQGHETIADWLAAVAGWSQLKIAAGLRLHREAAGLLRQGRIAAASWTVPAMLAAIDASKAAPAALPWEDAAPVCQATIRLVADATRGWHRTTHWLHHSTVREAVLAVLVVADRLQHKQDSLPAPAPIPQRPRRRGAAYNAARNVVLPMLPPEIWFHMMQFFQRVWWDSFAGLVQWNCD